MRDRDVKYIHLICVHGGRHRSIFNQFKRILMLKENINILLSILQTRNRAREPLSNQLNVNDVIMICFSCWLGPHTHTDYTHTRMYSSFHWNRKHFSDLFSKINFGHESEPSDDMREKMGCIRSTWIRMWNDGSHFFTGICIRDPLFVQTFSNLITNCIR